MTNDTCPGYLAVFQDGNSTIGFFNANSSFSSAYASVHRYIVATICVIGVTFNMLHILVLMQRKLRASAVNNILAAIALCDVLTLTSYFIYLWRFKFFPQETDVNGYPFVWIAFRYVHAIVTISTHGGSLYLCSLTAFVRWISIERLNSTWAERRIVWRICTFIMVAMVLLSVPSVIVYPMWSTAEEATNGQYSIHLLDDRCALLKLYLLQTGVFFKMMPCILLFFFTVGLLQKLREANRTRRLLREGIPSTEKTPTNDRTTLMLILMLTVFLLTELPQGVTAILITLFASDVYNIVFAPLMQMANMMSFINCNVGYVLYPAMSSVYRAALRDLFLPRKKGVRSSTMSKTVSSTRA